MTASRLRRLAPLALIVAAAGPLSACSALDRIGEIGEPPAMTSIQNPVEQKEYVPVSLPMPAPEPTVHEANSLWRSGSRGFFKDQRARRVGDLLTVQIDINDKAQLNNKTTRQRDASEGAGLPNFLGLEGSLNDVLPEAVDPENLIAATSASDSSGQGSIGRSERISLDLAAIVTQILPNGNLVVQGRQEVRVNSELRELIITGVVRPEDITAGNTISYEKIAEARISYGGRGTISDVQQPRYGQQLYDIVFPF